MAAVVNADSCIACGACTGACPVGAIELEDKAVVKEDDCISCGACTGACPVGAIEI